MTISKKAAVIGIVAGLLAFFLGPVIWEDTGAYQVTSGQMTLFIILAATTAITFGVGAAFLFTSWPAFKKLQNKTLALWVYISIAWLLVSWWPHENLHRVIGEEIHGLLGIEYGFHVTSYIAGIIVAVGIPKLLKNKS
jgi:hypothetical protein